MTTPEEAVAVLNRLHKADPSVLPQLLDIRVPCNQAVIEDPTIQVMGLDADGKPVKSSEPAAEIVVGWLGVLNGIFGVAENGKGYIGMIRLPNGAISHFKMVNG